MRKTLLLAPVTLAGPLAAQPAPRWASAVDHAKGYGVADAETGRRVTERTRFQTGSVTKLFTGAHARRR